MSREIHIHIEEPSMGAFLQELLPRLLPENVAWRTIDHGSKSKLLAQLPQRLLGYAKTPIDYRPKALVLIDRDNDDCVTLKSQLEAAAVNAGLRHKSQLGDGTFEVVNRIVIEELEAWYFGDLEAVAEAWPGVRPQWAKSAKYRDPDAITGGTHEAFLRMLQRAGHLKDVGKLPKIETARTIAPLIASDRNRSSSFQHFLSGLNALVRIA